MNIMSMGRERGNFLHTNYVRGQPIKPFQQLITIKASHAWIMRKFIHALQSFTRHCTHLTTVEASDFEDFLKDLNLPVVNSNLATDLERDILRGN